MPVDSERVAQLQLRMAADHIDAVVLRLPENILLMTGYWTQLGGMGFVYIPREGSGTLILPDYEESEASEFWAGDMKGFSMLLGRTPVPEAVSKILRDLAVRDGAVGGRIGYEGSFEMLSPPAHAGEPNAVGLPTQQLIASSFESEGLVDITTTLEAIRAVKSSHELARITVANEIVMLGLDRFKEYAQPGRAEADIAAEVEATIQRRGHGYKGARVVRAYAMVWSGEDTAMGWWAFRSRNRAVAADELVMIELATVVDGYWTDHTRTVVAGRPTGRQRRAFEAVRAAQEAAISAACSGKTGSEVDAVARSTCQAAGFEQFPHHTGHGLGFRYHERRPQLVPDSKDELLRGMVIAVEPGIYEKGLGGFRWEDDCVVEDSGARRLANTDFGLD